MKTTPKHSRVMIGAALLTALFAAGCQKHEANETNGNGATTTPPTTAPAAPASSTSSTTEPASGTADNSGKSAGTVLDDTVITTKVKTALLADSDVKGLQINVETTDGVVTLSGTVDNQEQIDHAGKIAQDVQGVKSVTNNLTVKQ